MIKNNYTKAIKFLSNTGRLFSFCYFFSLSTYSAQISIKDSTMFHVSQGTSIAGSTQENKAKIYITEGTTISNPEMLTNAEVHYIQYKKTVKKFVNRDKIAKKIPKKLIRSHESKKHELSEQLITNGFHDTYFYQLKDRISFVTNNRENRTKLHSFFSILILNIQLYPSNKAFASYKNNFFNTFSNRKTTIRPPPDFCYTQYIS